MIGIRRILCPTDFSDASMSAVPYAIETARLFKAQVFVIHVVPPLPPLVEEPGIYIQPPTEYLDYLRSDADKRLDHILSKRIPPEVNSAKVLVDGDAAYEIIQAVEKLRIDLITIAIHGRTGSHHQVLGSVAEKVVRMSQVPVLTVRGEAAVKKEF